METKNSPSFKIIEKMYLHMISADPDYFKKKFTCFEKNIVKKKKLYILNINLFGLV